MNWISNWANQTTWYYYDNYGSLTSVAYPNNTQTQYYFDTVGKLTALLILRNGSSVLEQLNYEYDGDGNRTRMVDYAGNTTRFYYDGLHRLTWEYRLGSHAYDYQYSYDSVGNRMTKISNGTETTYYAYNELNQLTTSTVGSMISHYTYDNNGNMTYDDRGIILYPKHFTWNQKNQLIQFDYAGISYLTLRYQYDVDGRKCYQISTTAGVPKYYRYLYDGTRVLQENEPHPLSGWNLGGRPVAVYTLAPGEVGNIISVRRSTTDYFYHYDGMGNVLFLTDTAGNKAAEYVMDSFGNIAYTQGPSVNSYLWRTKEYSSFIEAYFLENSLYQSKVNRSISINYPIVMSFNDDPYGINIHCEECDYRVIDNYRELLMWKNSLTILTTHWSNDDYLAYYYSSDKKYAETKCHDRTPTIIWKETMKENSPCVNCVIQDHENVHCRQCRDIGEEQFRQNQGENLWNNLEKEAYQETWNKINEYLDKIIKYRKEKGLPL